MADQTGPGPYVAAITGPPGPSMGAWDQLACDRPLHCPGLEREQNSRDTDLDSGPA